jgi:glutaredoxin
MVQKTMVDTYLSHARGNARARYADWIDVFNATPTPHTQMALPSGKWTVYMKMYCPFAINAYKLLQIHKQPFKVYDIDAIGADKVITTLGNRIPPSHTTSPIIFHNTQFIGGYTDLEAVLPAILKSN